VTHYHYSNSTSHFFGSSAAQILAVCQKLSTNVYTRDPETYCCSGNGSDKNAQLASQLSMNVYAVYERWNTV